ncbi:MAG: response regulator [Planctomycetes bacterium]|nr:response regulator [Planctomycetota bacterium]
MVESPPAGKPLPPAILVAEDNRLLLNLLRMQFEKDGQYRILYAADGKAALEVIERELPVLVLTDMMMPLIDGVELCQRVKTNPRTSHIRLVMMTAHPKGLDRLRQAKIQPDAFVPKPFKVSQLVTKVFELLLKPSPPPGP